MKTTASGAVRSGAAVSFLPLMTLAIQLQLQSPPGPVLLMALLCLFQLLRTWLLVCLLLWSGVRAAVAAGVPVFGITSGQEPAVLAAAGVCMLIDDFHQLVQLAQEQCKSTDSAAAAAAQAGGGKAAGAGDQLAAGQLHPIVVDSR